MTSTGSDDPARRLADYYPAWLDNLAGDVTLEGSMMDGLVQGAEAVADCPGAYPIAYDYQEFHFVGPLGDNGWSRTTPPGSAVSRSRNITVVTRNAAGQTQHVVGNYRPRSTTAALVPADRRRTRRHPLGEHFLASGSERSPAPSVRQ